MMVQHARNISASKSIKSLLPVGMHESSDMILESVLISCNCVWWTCVLCEVDTEQQHQQRDRDRLACGHLLPSTSSGSTTTCDVPVTESIGSANQDFTYAYAKTRVIWYRDVIGRFVSSPVEQCRPACQIQSRSLKTSTHRWCQRNSTVESHRWCVLGITSFALYRFTSLLLEDAYQFFGISKPGSSCFMLSTLCPKKKEATKFWAVTLSNLNLF